MTGETIEVRRPLKIGKDAFGNQLNDWEIEEVDNVLVDPFVSFEKMREFGADRPKGTRLSVRFHFPKGYTKEMRGCFIHWNGRDYRVVGDPVSFPEYNTPGEWNYPVDTEVCDG